jgi:hypothetical protein
MYGYEPPITDASKPNIQIYQEMFGYASHTLLFNNASLPSRFKQQHKNISYTQGRIYARATGWQISRGGILKKIKIEVWYAEKKRLSTGERFKGDFF